MALAADYTQTKWWIDDETSKEIATWVAKGGKQSIDYCKDKLEDWKKINVNVAVMGYIKSGKSTYINSVRGLSADDEGAAAVGVTEETKVAAPYPHPKNPKLIFWDIPGAGNTFKKDEYLTHFPLENYDFILIFCGDTFSEIDKMIVEEIKKRDMGFFFVRSKVHNSIRDNKSSHPRTHKLEAVLECIRDNIATNLGSAYEEKNVFLIDSHRRELYDWEKLEKAILKEMKPLKKKAFVLSMAAHSETMIKEKVKVLRKQIWLVAAASGAGAMIPMPALGAAIDLTIITATASHYIHQLGLDEDSVSQLGRVFGIDPTLLMPIVKGMASNISVQGINNLIEKAAGSMVIGEVAEEMSKYFLPIVGSFIAGTISFAGTMLVLKALLSTFEARALKLIREAISKSAERMAEEDRDY